MIFLAICDSDIYSFNIIIYDLMIIGQSFRLTEPLRGAQLISSNVCTDSNWQVAVE